MNTLCITYVMFLNKKHNYITHQCWEKETKNLTLHRQCHKTKQSTLNAGSALVGLQLNCIPAPASQQFGAPFLPLLS